MSIIKWMKGMSVRKEVGMVVVIAKKRHVSCRQANTALRDLAKIRKFTSSTNFLKTYPWAIPSAMMLGVLLSGQKREWEIRQYAAWPLGSWYGEHGEEAKKVDLSLSRISQSVI